MSPSIRALAWASVSVAEPSNEGPFGLIGTITPAFLPSAAGPPASGGSGQGRGGGGAWQAFGGWAVRVAAAPPPGLFSLPRRAVGRGRRGRAGPGPSGPFP